MFYKVPHGRLRRFHSSSDLKHAWILNLEKWSKTNDEQRGTSECLRLVLNCWGVVENLDFRSSKLMSTRSKTDTRRIHVRSTKDFKKNNRRPTIGPWWLESGRVKNEKHVYVFALPFLQREELPGYLATKKFPILCGESSFRTPITSA